MADDRHSPRSPRTTSRRAWCRRRMSGERLRPLLAATAAGHRRPAGLVEPAAGPGGGGRGDPRRDERRRPGSHGRRQDRSRRCSRRCPAWSSDQPEAVGAIYIAPIKALLNNQSERLGLYTEMVGLHHFVWHGDTTDHERRRFLREPAELLMTTPGVAGGHAGVAAGRHGASCSATCGSSIIDEIHAVAGTDRGAHLMSVLERIARLSRHDVQRIGLSATVGNPDAILAWLQGTSQRAGQSRRPAEEARPPAAARRPSSRIWPRSARATPPRVAKGGKSLFFCQSRSVTEAVAEHMRRAGTTVFVHHSAVSRRSGSWPRNASTTAPTPASSAPRRWNSASTSATWTACCRPRRPTPSVRSCSAWAGPAAAPARWPTRPSSARRSEGVLQAIALIELAKSGWVESVEVSDRCWPVLIHQLLALALAERWRRRRSRLGAPVPGSGLPRHRAARSSTG